MATKPPEYKTLVVDNFKGTITDYLFGDINSGKSFIQVVSGQNPFIKPGQLTWSEAPTLIDSGGSVITDLIMDGKERVESGILYVYCIGHTGRLYKIQVNNPATFNPDYDNPVLITTLAINSPTFTRGGFIEFFGATERIYIGHDMGVTMVNFDGTGETFVGTLGSWTQTVPRPLKKFAQYLYAGNGSNLAQIIDPSTVGSYTQLSPGFPANTQTRDLELSPDGNYLQAIVSRLPLWDVTSSTQQTISTANTSGFLYQWNGSDVAPTAVTTYPNFAVTGMTSFQNYQYVFGSDQYGMAVFNPLEKVQYATETQYQSPNAVRSTGNLLTYINPLYFNGTLQNVYYIYGSFDQEVGNTSYGPIGYWSPFFHVATSPQTDIVITPWQLPISNEGLGISSNGYTNNLFGTSKIYFSTLETSATPTTKYRLYKWRTATSLQLPTNTNALLGTYQTQTQMFSKKMLIKEVRIYGEPWVTGNSFTIELTGSGNTFNVATGSYGAISGSSKTFSIGSGLTAGNDFASYNPSIAPTYALGVAISNVGSVNHTINKVEIDYTEGGK